MKVGIQYAPHDAVSAPLVANEEEKSLHASYVQHLGGGGGRNLFSILPNVLKPGMPTSYSMQAMTSFVSQTFV